MSLFRCWMHRGTCQMSRGIQFKSIRYSLYWCLKALYIFFLRIFITIIRINIAIWYHQDILPIPFMLEFVLSSDPFPWINPTPTGCSHSWCPFLRCRWNSRPNYKCEIASLISILAYTPIKNVHMLALSNAHMHICIYKTS